MERWIGFNSSIVSNHNMVQRVFSYKAQLQPDTVMMSVSVSMMARTKGLVKLLFSQVLKFASIYRLSFFMLRIYRFKQAGVNVADVIENYKNILAVGAVFALEKMKKNIM